MIRQWKIFHKVTNLSNIPRWSLRLRFGKSFRGPKDLSIHCNGSIITPTRALGDWLHTIKTKRVYSLIWHNDTLNVAILDYL